MSLSEFTKRLRPKTYSVAVYLVVAVLLIQAIALVSIFYYRRAASSTVASREQQVAGRAEEARRQAERDAAAAAAAPPVAVGSVEGSSSGASGSTEVPAKVPDLIQQAVAATQAQQWDAAAAALVQAERLEEKNPRVLALRAELEEKRGDLDAAQRYWRKVFELGAEAAGESFVKARERLLVLQAPTSVTSTALPETRQRLVFRAIDKRVLANTADELKLELRIVIAVPSGERSNLDASKVGVKLYFYDRDGKGTLINNRQVKAVFDAFGGWKQSDVETLVATYRLDRAAMPTGEAARDYYGYYLRLFYDGQLQDERSEPPELPHQVGTPPA